MTDNIPSPASDNAQPDHSRPWLKSYPVDIDWNAKIIAGTLPKGFDAMVRKYAKRQCLNFMGKKLTYKEVGEMVDHFAKGLQEQGIGPGSKVGLCLPNTPFYVIAYHAALKTGATVVNFNPLYAKKEMEHQINDSETDIMITINVKKIHENVEAMLGKTCLKKVITCNLADPLPRMKGTALRVSEKVKSWFGKENIIPVPKDDAQHVSFKKLLKNDGKPSNVEVESDDIAVLQYTGGTTGVPKAAMLSHGNLISNVRQARTWFAAEQTHYKPEKVLAVLPFFHVFSMNVQMNLALSIGAELIMLPKFEIKQLLETIDKEKPTMFAGVPTIYKAICDYPQLNKYDISSVTSWQAGGAPLPETIRNEFKQLTGHDIVEGYGLSETSPLAVAVPLQGEKKMNSIGLPVQQTELKIMDLQFPDKTVPINVEGEICLRGPQVMKGYWKQPEETANVMTHDGFFRTGDVGYMDEDGYTFIVDRIKDMIIASGLKVFPRKVEDAILQHPAVSEVVVGGVKDDYRGENVKAYIVLKPEHQLTQPELKEFLKERLASYEMPRLVDFRDSLPKTLIGKPDRKALKVEELQKAPKPPKPPAAA